MQLDRYPLKQYVFHTERRREEVQFERTAKEELYVKVKEEELHTEKSVENDNNKSVNREKENNSLG